MLDDTAGSDVPLTGRQALNPPLNLWEDFDRTVRRAARHGLSGFEITMGILTAIFFLVLAVHIAAATPTRSTPPPAIVYAPAPSTTTTLTTTAH